MNLAKKITCIFFIVFVFGFSLLQLLPDKTFSDQENRVLAQFPEWSIEAMESGQFADRIEEYASDQFPFRNAWILINHLYEKMLAKIEIGGNYVLSDRLIQQFSTLNEAVVSKNIEKINAFSELTGKDMDVLLIPTASSIDGEHLSSFANEVDQKELLDVISSKLNPSVSLVNCYDKLDASKENVYYATDHHFNEKGAYLVYESYMEHLQQTPAAFTYEKVSSGFCGTLYSSSGAFYMPCDDIVRIDPVESVDVQVEYEENNEIVHTVYNDANLEKKDKYTYYLDGNHSVVDITTSLSDKPSLLVIADSYSHLMAPYLISSFSEIRIVDLRYYRVMLSEQAENYDKILVLYSLENFSGDDGLSWLR